MMCGWKGLCLLWAVCSLYSGAQAQGGQAGLPAEQNSAQAGDRVRVELFVMPHCPYGVRAETALAPVLKDFGDQIDFQLYFIAKEAGKEDAQAPVARVSTPRNQPACEASTVGGTGRFRSLHGDAEVEEGIRQTAMMALYPDRYYEYILCRNKAVHADNWETCATAAGMHPARVVATASGPEGEALYLQNIRRGNLLGINSSPTLRVNGAEVKDFLTPHALARRICRGKRGPGACEAVPVCGSDPDCSRPGKVGVCVKPNRPDARCRFSDPVVFQITGLNDPECKVCETGPFIRSTLALFPGARIRTLTIGSAEGQALVERYGIDRVPAFVLDEGFDRTARFARFARLVRRVSGKYLVDPRMIPVTRFLDRAAQPGRLDLFLGTASSFAMGTAGELIVWLRKENALDRLYVHYLGGGEDTWHLCVQKALPEGHLNYLVCRVRGVVEGQRAPSREACIKTLGLDPERIGRCATGAEGARLLEKSLGLAADLGLQRRVNPTVMMDNRIVVTGGMVRRVRDLFHRIHPGQREGEHDAEMGEGQAQRR